MPPALPDIPDIPDRFETGRLLVRAPQPGDGYAVYAAVLESLPALRAWPAALPWALQEPSPAESVAFCCDGYCCYQARTDMPMLIFRKEDNCLIGATNLPSRKVAERAGFRLEGIRCDDRSAPAGTPSDTCVYVVSA